MSQNLGAGAPGMQAALNGDAVHPVLQSINYLNQLYSAANVNQNVVKQQVDSLKLNAATNSRSAPDPDQIESSRIASEGVAESVSKEVFSSYEHSDIIPGCQPHPGDIVEAGPLASLSLPASTYPLADSLPPNLIKDCLLSSLQLEGILYACQRHQILLPNGQRAGFFIGDAAGVGKGRQISGIILDNLARGRDKHVWFSISTDLIVDAKRDLTDIGCHVKVIDGCQELDRETRVLGLPKDFKEGVVFSTYATLVSSVQRGNSVTGTKVGRLQQLVDWCGGNHFEGCLVFDECHKAKNFVPGKEQASTKVALAVMSIQRLLPKARVLYCSATGVTDVKNMAFMERLGLWGDGAPFRSFEQFLGLVQKKGLGMAEILAMEMKTSGMYVSRGLSYKQAEFITVEAPLTAEQRKVYDTSAHVWSELRKALENAIGRTGFSGGRLWQQFWACHQRFFKQLCLGMKVPSVIQVAKEALDSGHCVVIGLQTTGEASLESEIGKNKGEVTSFMSLCREILTRFITQYFPTKIEGKSEPTEDPWSVTAKKMLLEFADKIQMPDSPLDEIIDKLGGTKCVAEMTGRRGRIVRNSPKDSPHYELRAPDVDSYGKMDSLNVQERNMFMEGKKFVAIISDAASTGISLHADTRANNQRRRVHITMELPWSADKAVQQLGRSHRSNQSSGPLYKLLTTDLGGERRFAAAVARRLQSLGALTKGDRRAATGANLGEFNFDTVYGRSALRLMYNCICQKKIVPGINFKNITSDFSTFEEFNLALQESMVLMGLVDMGTLIAGNPPKDKDTNDVSKFLNRILGLSVQKQNLIFSYFTECMKLTIQQAKSEGRYNEGMLDIVAESVKMVGESKVVFKETNRGHAETRLTEVEIDRGMSWEKVVTRANHFQGKEDGFYISKREMWGRKLVILATKKDNSSYLFRIARPNTGLSQFDEERAELFHKYTPISAEKAEEIWKNQYEQSVNGCIHGNSCKHKKTCKVGSRLYRFHLICGSIVTLMSVLESTLNRFAQQLNLTKSESVIRVVRVQFNNSERVVGIRYPAILIGEVEKTLKEQQTIESLPYSQSILKQSGTGDIVVTPDNSASASVDQSVATLTTEDVSPVNPKALSKALRPPVTLRNFFKRTESRKTDLGVQCINQELSNEQTESCSLRSCDDTGAENSLKKEDIKETDNSCASDTKDVMTGKRRDESCQNSNSLTADTKSTSSKKRPREQNGASGFLRPNKKAKQSTIMSSFKKISETKEQTQISCPVCSKEFEKGTSNSDINSHIDNCLIE